MHLISRIEGLEKEKTGRDDSELPLIVVLWKAGTNNAAAQLDVDDEATQLFHGTTTNRYKTEEAECYKDTTSNLISHWAELREVRFIVLI